MNENQQKHHHKAIFEKKMGLLVLLVVTVIAALALVHGIFYDYGNSGRVAMNNWYKMPGMMSHDSGMMNSGGSGYFPNGNPLGSSAGMVGFTQDGITVLQPLPNAAVSLPLNVIGFGLPPFEGVPGYYQILDANGKVISQHNLSAANLGPKQPYGFIAVINNFSLPTSSKGSFTLRVHNDNASGLPQNDRIVDVKLQLQK